MLAESTWEDVISQPGVDLNVCTPKSVMLKTATFLQFYKNIILKKLNKGSYLK